MHRGQYLSSQFESPNLSLPFKNSQIYSMDICNLGTHTSLSLSICRSDKWSYIWRWYWWLLLTLAARSYNPWWSAWSPPWPGSRWGRTGRSWVCPPRWASRPARRACPCPWCLWWRTVSQFQTCHPHQLYQVLQRENGFKNWIREYLWYLRGEANLRGKSRRSLSLAMSATGPKMTTGRGKPGCRRLTLS